MTKRGKRLHATADEQIAELIDLVSGLDEAALRLPCPGREKLGDGTVGASLRHTADNYQQIAGFVQTSDQMSSAHAPTPNGAHRIPRLLRAIGHRPADHAEHEPAPANTTTSTRPTPSISPQLSQSSQPRATPSGASRSSPTTS